MTRVPLVCKFCGKTEGLHVLGELTILDAWRNIERAYYDGPTGQTSHYLDNVEWEGHTGWLEDEFTASGFACSECGAGPFTKLEDLVDVKYGRDKLGRILDEAGEPISAPDVGPNHLAIPLDS